MKRKTEEQFEAEKEGIRRDLKIEVLIDYKDYVNSMVPVPCRCLVCSHESRSLLGNLLRGHGCAKCGIVKNAEEKKFDESMFNAACSELESSKKIKILEPFESFVSAQTKMKAVCLVCGSELMYKLANRNRVGCGYCAKKIPMNETQYNAFVAAQKERGFSVKTLFRDYKNKDSILDASCDKCGFEFQRTKEMLEKRKSCPLCGFGKATDKERVAALIVRSEKIGLRLLDKIPDNCTMRSRFRFACDKCGHVIERSLMSLRQGSGCKICAKSDGFTEEQFNDAKNKIVTDRKIEILTPYSEYRRNSQKLECLCLVCGGKLYTPTMNSLQRGFGCIECKKKLTASKQEQEIAEAVSAIIPDVVIERNTRGELNGLEIDVYLPEFRVGIEHSGAYWHSEERRGRLYHQRKSTEAIRAGISLFQIFDDEWRDRREQVVQLLRDALVHKPSINALECEVLVTWQDRGDIIEFFDKYHVDGWAPCLLAVSLLLGGEVVYSVSFRNPRNKKYSGRLEVLRECVSENVHVVGGTEKVFRTALEETGLHSVLYYHNLRYGLLPKRLLLTEVDLIDTTDVDIQYIESGTRVSRYGKGGKERRGLPRVFGAGFDVYEFAD